MEVPAWRLDVLLTEHIVDEKLSLVPGQRYMRCNTRYTCVRAREKLFKCPPPSHPLR